MVRVRYRGGYSFVHNEHGPLDEGDVVDVGDYTLAQFGQMFVRVEEETNHTADGEADAAESDADAADEPSLAFDPGEHTVGELESSLAGTGLSQPELERLLAAEQSGKNRTTAVEAIREAMPDDSGEAG